jgi:feruloyl esterase
LIPPCGGSNPPAPAKQFGLWPDFSRLETTADISEEGVAPETIIATNVQMTRPLCVFPKVAKYMGSGDTNVAANFTCVADEPDFNQMPAPKYGP